MTLLLEKLYQERSSEALRKKAWAKWQGFPTRKAEAFRYVSLKKLEETTQLISAEACFEYEMPSQLVVLPLQEAKRTYGPLLEKRSALLMQKEKDPFFLLNQAVGGSGLFIYVPPQVRIEKPLEIVQKIKANQAIHPKIEIFLGKGSELTTILTIENETGGFWNNANINVTVEEEAHYRHFDHAGYHPEAWDFLSFQGELKEKATLKYFSFGRGARVQRRDFAISLAGEYAEAELKGMSLLDSQLEGHVHIRMDHLAPNARSHQLFKHVLAGRARSSFEGKIFVEKEAQKTEAYQLNNNLILNEKAAAFSKPNLEIFADDVKASHGATVSKPSLDELFYLRSRGLSREAARDHLVRGFCRELVQDIPIPALYDQFSGEINAYLS